MLNYVKFYEEFVKKCFFRSNFQSWMSKSGLGFLFKSTYDEIKPIFCYSLWRWFVQHYKRTNLDNLLFLYPNNILSPLLLVKLL